MFKLLSNSRTESTAPHFPSLGSLLLHHVEHEFAIEIQHSSSSAGSLPWHLVHWKRIQWLISPLKHLKRQKVGGGEELGAASGSTESSPHPPLLH